MRITLIKNLERPLSLLKSDQHLFLLKPLDRRRYTPGVVQPAVTRLRSPTVHDHSPTVHDHAPNAEESFEDLSEGNKHEDQEEEKQKQKRKQGPRFSFGTLMLPRRGLHAPSPFAMHKCSRTTPTDMCSPLAKPPPCLQLPPLSVSRMCNDRAYMGTSLITYSPSP